MWGIYIMHKGIFPIKVAQNSKGQGKLSPYDQFVFSLQGPLWWIEYNVDCQLSHSAI